MKTYRSRLACLLLSISFVFLSGCSAFSQKDEDFLVGTWYLDLEKSGIDISILIEDPRIVSAYEDGVTFLSDYSYSGEFTSYINYEQESYWGLSAPSGKWSYLVDEKILKMGDDVNGSCWFEIEVSGNEMKSTITQTLSQRDQLDELEYKTLYWVKDNKPTVDNRLFDTELSIEDFHIYQNGQDIGLPIMEIPYNESGVMQQYLSEQEETKRGIKLSDRATKLAAAYDNIPCAVSYDYGHRSSADINYPVYKDLSSFLEEISLIYSDSSFADVQSEPEPFREIRVGVVYAYGYKNGNEVPLEEIISFITSGGFPDGFTNFDDIGLVEFSFAVADDEQSLIITEIDIVYYGN